MITVQFIALCNGSSCFQVILQDDELSFHELSTRELLNQLYFLLYFMLFV